MSEYSQNNVAYDHLLNCDIRYWSKLKGKGQLRQKIITILREY